MGLHGRTAPLLTPILRPTVLLRAGLERISCLLERSQKDDLYWLLTRF